MRLAKEDEGGARRREADYGERERVRAANARGEPSARAGQGEANPRAAHRGRPVAAALAAPRLYPDGFG